MSSPDPLTAMRNDYVVQLVQALEDFMAPFLQANGTEDPRVPAIELMFHRAEAAAQAVPGPKVEVAHILVAKKAFRSSLHRPAAERRDRVQDAIDLLEATIGKQ